jgi:hypothetical protein
MTGETKARVVCPLPKNDPNDPRPYTDRVSQWYAQHRLPTPAPAVRSREELEAYLAWMPTYYADMRDRSYYAGMLATIEWAAGKRRLAPISGREQPEGQLPNGDRISSEHGAAYRGMSIGVAAMLADDGRFAPESITSAYSHSYFTAVENTAYWLMGSEGLTMPEDWRWPRKFEDFDFDT